MFYVPAEVVKLADTHGLGPCALIGLGVQISPSAPFSLKNIFFIPLLSFLLALFAFFKIKNICQIKFFT